MAKTFLRTKNVAVGRFFRGLQHGDADPAHAPQVFAAAIGLGLFVIRFDLISSRRRIIQQLRAFPPSRAAWSPYSSFCRSLASAAPSRRSAKSVSGAPCRRENT